MAESSFQRFLIQKIRSMFDGCIVLKNDASYLQGVPDLLILFEDKWAALEVKAAITSPKRPNQRHYVKTMNDMSYAAFVYPGNEEDVLYDLQQTFRPNRSTRFS